MDLSEILPSRWPKFCRIKLLKLISFLLVSLLLAFKRPETRENSINHCKQFLTQTPDWDGHKYYWKDLRCKIFKYKPLELKTCLDMKKEGPVKFALMGDSRIRNIRDMMDFILFDLATSTNDFKLFDLRNYKENNFNLDFIWASQTEIGNQTLILTPDRDHNTPMYEALSAYLNKSEDPDLLLMGNGLWSIYTKPDQQMALVEYRIGLRKLRPILENLISRGRTRIIWMISPIVVEYMLTGNHIKLTNAALKVHTQIVIEEYSDLAKVSPGFSFWTTPDYFFGRENDIDPIHFIHLEPAGKLIHMLFNIICNEKMNLSEDNCCSNSSRHFTIYQNIIFLSFTLIGTVTIAVLILRLKNKYKNCRSAEEETPNENKFFEVLLSLTKLGIILGYFYIAEISDLFIPGYKHFSFPQFWISIITIFFFGIFCNKQTEESTFLNTHQLNESKGWIILMLLICNYNKPDNFQDLNFFIQFLKSSLLFIFSYEQVIEYWNKSHMNKSQSGLTKNFFRLNCFVVLLCFTINSNILEFTFTTQLTIWFIILKIILWIRYPQWIPSAKVKNLPHSWLSIKLVLKSLIFGLYSIFKVDLPKIDDPNDYSYSLEVDHLRLLMDFDFFSSISGALFGLGVIWFERIENAEKKQKQVYGFALMVLTATYILFANCNQFGADFFGQTRVHPIVTVIPIIYYIILRNINSFMRQRFSYFFKWFGDFSLEMYVAQNHIWQTKGSHGILVLFPDSELFNFLLTTSIFVLVSHGVHLIMKNVSSYFDSEKVNFEITCLQSNSKINI